MKPVLAKKLLTLAATGSFALTCSAYGAETAAETPANAAAATAPSPAPATPANKPAADAKQTRLDDTVVTAKRTAETKPEVAPREAPAMKLAGTPHETPHSVSIVNAEQIRERNYSSLDDMMDTTPGVFVNSRNAGGYHYISRGYRMTASETMLDGFRGNYSSGQNSQSLFGVERVVFMRGPSSLAYGAAASPGGTINVIMRKPEEQSRTTLDFTTSTYAGNGRSFGDRGGLTAEVDSTGALSDELLYRVGVAGENSQQYSDDVTNRSAFGLGALTWKPLANDRLKITPIVHATRTNTPPGSGMVYSRTNSFDDLSSLDNNAYEGTRTDEITVAGLDINAGDKEEATLNAGYRYMSFDTDLNTWNPTGTVNALGQISRVQTKRQNDNDSHNFDLNGTLESRPASEWRNRLMAGVNGRFLQARQRNATFSSNAAQSPYNVYTGATAAPLLDRSTGWNNWSETDNFEWNTYLMDQAALFDDRLVLTGGVGYGQLVTSGRPTLDGEVTPYGAVLVNITREVATYASYSTSYAFADASINYEDASGNSFTPDPVSGDTKEVGAKFRLPDRKTNASVAYFWAERNNITTQSVAGDLNPNGNRYWFAIDGQSTEGVELASSLFLTENWHLDGTFAWITGSYNNGSAFEDRLAKTPEFSASLFSRHEFTEGTLKGLGHYVGVVWQDERLGGNGPTASANPLMLPAFYRVDAGLDYAVSTKFRLGFHVYNLLDEVIAVDGTNGGNLQIDAPRTFTLKATYIF